MRRNDLLGQTSQRQSFKGVTSLSEQNGAWCIACCPEIPGADGQGRTKDEAGGSLVETISRVLEARREEGLRGVPPEAIRGTVIVP